MLALITSPEAWAALVTLTVMEIVLGIDNVVFISLLVQRLPQRQALRARQIGLSLALVLRIALLFALSWLIGLQQSLFVGFGIDISWRDLILIAGGAFLVAKATMEMHAAVEGDAEEDGDGDERPSAVAGRAFTLIIGQVAVLDLVFSVDSILTAIGMAEHIEVMVAAVIVAVGIMFWASGPLSSFIAQHPTAKMLALAFLLMVGVMLVADGFDVHIPRGYVYAAMAFSVMVEMLNVAAAGRRQRRRRAPPGPGLD
ncbi:TerC family protein [Xanthobacter agilis]|uniref:Tellurium resistance membrane protein TerC n=1 Tax=Xanthobacter agilis TaxID=47492 RepID=A0ABU0LB09_XANAG|nr:TerC family protein [Xanthobacter agilis]MDQ0504327.1 putative tellurium resistance membrane protein TerC [Xanthobacter agilis]